MKHARVVMTAVMAGSVLTGLGCASTDSAALDFAQSLSYHQERPSHAAVSGELGSPTNPVRATGPMGQRDYLHRLRCADDSSPAFERIGSTGVGPYGRMVDAYRVQCADQPEMVIHMDLYHCDEETEAVDGFVITPRVIEIPRDNCG